MKQARDSKGRYTAKKAQNPKRDAKGRFIKAGGKRWANQYGSGVK